MSYRLGILPMHFETNLELGNEGSTPLEINESILIGASSFIKVNLSTSGITYFRRC
jgi:hypothetical protein